MKQSCDLHGLIININTSVFLVLIFLILIFKLEDFLETIRLFSTKMLLYGKYQLAEMSSEPCQTSKMEHFAKIVNNFLPLTIFAKCSILGV